MVNTINIVVLVGVSAFALWINPGETILAVLLLLVFVIINKVVS